MLHKSNKSNAIMDLVPRDIYDFIILINGFSSAESFAEMIFNLIYSTSIVNLIIQSLGNIIADSCDVT